MRRSATLLGLASLLAGSLACLAATDAQPVVGDRRIGMAGVTLALPAGWHALSRADFPRPYADPIARLVVASAPIAESPSGCKFATFRFAPGAVGIVIMEWTHPASPDSQVPPRPLRFTEKTLPLHRAPAVECWPGPGGGVQFVDHGRQLAAFLLLGRNASAKTVAQARAVLNTLVVTRTRN